ncbi:hypothetical protein Athai_36030 [Actinocatenispora thailandica]|uniref:Uncharacterized protein n=2 Tax=Actinocatenispora thailandica TaxID=227318 RepID=A0A7R7DQM9_9ACTN|nr:hypothetical protein Athai_36030 [Actinocatenispora thailandica]
MINPSGKSGQVIAAGKPFTLRLKKKRPAEPDPGTERDGDAEPAAGADTDAEPAAGADTDAETDADEPDGAERTDR